MFLVLSDSDPIAGISICVSVDDSSLEVILSNRGGILSDMLGSSMSMGDAGGLTCILTSGDKSLIISPRNSMSVSLDSPDFSLLLLFIYSKIYTSLHFLVINHTIYKEKKDG